MILKNRRRHFLVDKSLQSHYALYIILTLLVICSVGMMGNYYGIWASVIKAFSEESLQESLITSAQLNEYEASRRPATDLNQFPSLRGYRETALLSQRQKEIIQQIMDDAHRKTVALGILLLFFIGWGSIFLTHKVAGPVFKLTQYMEALKKGDLSARIGFRKFDELHYLEKHFNDLASTLDTSLSQMKWILKDSKDPAAVEAKKELSKFKTSAD